MDDSTSQGKTKAKAYRCYRRYVDAESEYLNKPTAENWEKKEKAFEDFNEALIQQKRQH